MMKWIDNIILGVTDLHDTSDIYELCDLLDINIITVQEDNTILSKVLCNNEAIYQRNISGMEVIYIKNNLDEKYKEFIVAHELGHALLHVNIPKAAFNIDLINTGKLERQATYFALKLLNININSIEYEGMTMQQIAKSLHLPEKSLELLY